MAHKCKVCDQLSDSLTKFGKHGWYHPICVFDAWQAALEELDGYRCAEYARKHPTPILRKSRCTCDIHDKVYYGCHCGAAEHDS